MSDVMRMRSSITTKLEADEEKKENELLDKDEMNKSEESDDE